MAKFLHAKARILAMALPLMATGPAWADALPPAALYAQYPALSGVRLSPDGKEIALLAPVGGHLALATRRLDDQHLMTMPVGDRLPTSVAWKTSDRLVASVMVNPANNDDVLAPDLPMFLFFNPDGTQSETLKTHGGLPTLSGYRDQVISLMQGDPGHILLQTDDRVGGSPRVVAVDVRTGRKGLDSAQREEQWGDGWLADATGAVRVSIRLGRTGPASEATHKSVFVRKDADGPWQSVYEGDVNKDPVFAPLGFEQDDPNLLMVVADGEGGKLAIRDFDVTKHEFGATLAADPACDAEPILRDHQPIGYSFPCHGDDPHYLDPAWQRDKEFVAATLKAAFVSVIDRTSDGKRVLGAVSEKIGAAPSYWLLDRTGPQPRLTDLGAAYPNLASDRLGAVKLITYPSRDGMTIPALLTLPPGGRSGPIPFVVLPHAEATGHDHSDFNYLVQFLVSRGYGVLQPQARGSTGYGHRFEQAGFQQWGQAIEDDITDGTRWLISQKLADPARIALVGERFGGYSALMGAVREPALYACIAAWQPVTDFNLFLWRRTRAVHSREADFALARIAPGGTDPDRISPIDNIDKIRVPVLLAAPRDFFAQPNLQMALMEEAMHRHGKAVVALHLDNIDGHLGLKTAEARQAWLVALDQFLAVNFRQQAVD